MSKPALIKRVELRDQCCSVIMDDRVRTGRKAEAALLMCFKHRSFWRDLQPGIFAKLLSAVGRATP